MVMNIEEKKTFFGTVEYLPALLLSSSGVVTFIPWSPVTVILLDDGKQSHDKSVMGSSTELCPVR